MHNNKKNIKVHILIGLPGAGKSTAIKEIMVNNKTNYVVVSRDIARAELGFCKEGEKIVGTRQQEDEVSAYCDKLIKDAAYFGDTIIVDNINLKRKYRDYFKDLLKDYNVEYHYHYVETKSLKTNILRREGQINEEVFTNMIKSFDWPEASEYDYLIYHFN
jgi:predicted kinase